jgi:hypothetical protein
MPWRTIEGETLAPATMPQLEVLLRGVFDKRRFLDLIRHFMVKFQQRYEKRRGTYSPKGRLRPQANLTSGSLRAIQTRSHRLVASAVGPAFIIHPF